MRIPTWLRLLLFGKTKAVHGKASIDNSPPLYYEENLGLKWEKFKEREIEKAITNRRR